MVVSAASFPPIQSTIRTVVSAVHTATRARRIRTQPTRRASSRRAAAAGDRVSVLLLTTRLPALSASPTAGSPASPSSTSPTPGYAGAAARAERVREALNEEVERINRGWRDLTPFERLARRLAKPRRSEVQADYDD